MKGRKLKLVALFRHKCSEVQFCALTLSS